MIFEKSKHFFVGTLFNCADLIENQGHKAW